jgi:glycosyltransferase involved in cell wall biosynthesis
VIPTCADLNRFSQTQKHPQRRVIGCLGTVLSGWFRIDWLARFITTAAKRDPDAFFEVTTLDDPNLVRSAIGGGEDLQNRITVKSSPSERIHEILQEQTACVMFFTDGLSKLGSSPTRMGEILGCGLPVIANEGVGDVAQIIRNYRVGVLVAGNSDAEMNAAWSELEVLLSDPELAARCRNAAETVFSLETGTAAYADLYARVLGAAKNHRQ